MAISSNRRNKLKMVLLQNLKTAQLDFPKITRIRPRYFTVRSECRSKKLTRFGKSVYDFTTKKQLPWVGNLVLEIERIKHIQRLKIVILQDCFFLFDYSPNLLSQESFEGEHLGVGLVRGTNDRLERVGGIAEKRLFQKADF